MRNVWLWAGILITATTAACAHPAMQAGPTPSSAPSQGTAVANAAQCTDDRCSPLYVIDGVIVTAPSNGGTAMATSRDAAVPLYVIDGVIVPQSATP